MNTKFSMVTKALIAIGGALALTGCAVYPVGPGYVGGEISGPNYGVTYAQPAYIPYSVQIYGGGGAHYDRGYRERRGWRDGHRGGHRGGHHGGHRR